MFVEIDKVLKVIFNNLNITVLISIAKLNYLASVYRQLPYISKNSHFYMGSRV